VLFRKAHAKCDNGKGCASVNYSKVGIIKLSARNALKRGGKEAGESGGTGPQTPLLMRTPGRISRTTLRITPAMETGLSDHIWDVEELGKPVRIGSGHGSIAPP
jgi:hypothetical protein